MDCLRPVSRWNKPTTRQLSLVIGHPAFYSLFKNPLTAVNERVKASLSSQRLGPSCVFAVAKAAAEVANAPWNEGIDKMGPRLDPVGSSQLDPVVSNLGFFKSLFSGILWDPGPETRPI